MCYSIAFDCLPHDLITEKFYAYGFDMLSIRHMQSYLIDKNQRVKTNNSHSLWSLIKYGVLRGSILSSILLNIFLCDMFVLVDSVGIKSYTNDNIPYTLEKTILVKNNLKTV